MNRDTQVPPQDTALIPISSPVFKSPWSTYIFICEMKMVALNFWLAGVKETMLTKLCINYEILSGVPLCGMNVNLPGKYSVESTS